MIWILDWYTCLLFLPGLRPFWGKCIPEKICSCYPHSDRAEIQSFGSTLQAIASTKNDNCECSRLAACALKDISSLDPWRMNRTDRLNGSGLCSDLRKRERNHPPSQDLLREASKKVFRKFLPEVSNPDVAWSDVCRHLDLFSTNFRTLPTENLFVTTLNLSTT